MPLLSPDSIQIVAAVFFGIALVHTFAAKQFERLSHRFPAHAGLFHLLGEVEVVFGFWAIVLVVAMALLAGPGEALAYAESRQYTEPLFVFVVMVIAASRPIFQAVTAMVGFLARRMPVRASLATAWLGLAAVPLLGSLITEPAAMTIAALLLSSRIFRPGVPEALKYFVLGVLFVNVSIGGTLSSFAVTDNAALTYLGSLIEGISDEAKYALVAGAVGGGGLTIIANAPNPAGVALLKAGFADETIGAVGLLLGALLPTAIALAALLL